MKDQDSILSKIEIAKPCSADWENMVGDERERACQLCKLNVYNISTMTNNEAESFLRQRLPEGRTCIRMFRRADGTIITDNCPRGLRAARDAVRRMQYRVAAAASMLMAFWGPVSAQSQDCSSNAKKNEAQWRQGDVAFPPQPTKFIMGRVKMSAPPINHLMGAPAPMAADMTPYRTKMQEKIKSIWQKQTRAKAEIKVVFKIQADGSVSDLKIAASSGNSKLDQKAIDAVKKAAPFGTLPAFCPSPFEADYTF